MSKEYIAPAVVFRLLTGTGTRVSSLSALFPTWIFSLNGRKTGIVCRESPAAFFQLLRHSRTRRVLRDWPLSRALGGLVRQRGGWLDSGSRISSPARCWPITACG